MAVILVILNHASETHNIVRILHGTKDLFCVEQTNALSQKAVTAMFWSLVAVQSINLSTDSLLLRLLLPLLMLLLLLLLLLLLRYYHNNN